MPGFALHPFTPAIDHPNMRRAGPELLSLALMDARNHTLHLLAQFQDALGSDNLQLPRAAPAPLMPPRWLAGHIAWFTEYWIARNTERTRGDACSSHPMRLAALDLGADLAWNPANCPVPQRHAADVPGMREVRAYLLETLELTLELLERAQPTDAGLYFYRLALAYEDLRGEQLIMLAQALGLALGTELPAPGATREPLALPGASLTLGSLEEPGFFWAQETGALAVRVGEFEIDAQPVTWQQYAEFVADGGYDTPSLWQAQGWSWVQSSRRRAPRDVMQMGAGGAVLLNRFGRSVHAAGTHAAQHLSWWEADAWARWAARRLPTEAEWELAATTALRRGFRWGEVQEWVADRLHPWPGFKPDPWSSGTDLDPGAVLGRARVLRGASFAARARAHDVRARAFALPEWDQGFTGFRTCAA